MSCIAEVATVAYFYGAVVMFVTIASTEHSGGNVLSFLGWSLLWPLVIVVIPVHDLVCAARDSYRKRKTRRD